MRYYLFFLLNICLLNGLAQSNKAIQQFLSTSGFENASIGICVKDVSGEEVISYNKDEALTPASTMKIVTTATALELLGEDYKFRTTLSLDEGNVQHLIVKGYGDPTLGSEYLSDNSNSFLDVWVEKIKGTIDVDKPLEVEVDDSFFGYNGVSSKWLHEDLGNYYAAGAYGISVFDNTYRLFFNTMNANPYSKILRTEPEMTDIVFLNTMKINTTGKDNGYISGEPFSNQRKLVGDIPAKRSSFSIKGDIPDPGLYLGQALSKQLERNNIQINNVHTTRNDFYSREFDFQNQSIPKEKEFYVHYSPSLRKIIRVVNERSNNHYTEHLIRAIGRSGNDLNKLPFSDALSQGIAKTKSFWTSKGLNTEALFMYDGCGLAPSDKISADLLCDILLYMQNESSYKNSFFASLPRAGSEGTVQNLLKGTRLEGKVFVKSGSIENVQCFAGYYRDGDKKYVFSVLVNNYNSPRKQVVKAIENLLLNIF